MVLTMMLRGWVLCGHGGDHGCNDDDSIDTYDDHCECNGFLHPTSLLGRGTTHAPLDVFATHVPPFSIHASLIAAARLLLLSHALMVAPLIRMIVTHTIAYLRTSFILYFLSRARQILAVAIHTYIVTKYASAW